MAGRRPVFDFAALVTSIQEADARLAAHAIRAVNFGLTLRNWMIGFYIAEFELRGSDRAAYGDRLLIELSKALSARQISNTGRRQLYQYLSFYRAYPQIVRAVSAQFRRLLPALPAPRIVRTASALFALAPDRLFGYKRNVMTEGDNPPTGLTMTTSSNIFILLFTPRWISRKATSGVLFFWEAKMPSEPAVKRTVAFFDGQSLFHVRWLDTNDYRPKKR